MYTSLHINKYPCTLTLVRTPKVNVPSQRLNLQIAVESQEV